MPRPVPGSEVAFHLGFPVNCSEAEELGLMSLWPTFFGLTAVVACGVRRVWGAVVECPNCRAVAPEEAKFCQECGSPLPRSCPSCGYANRAGAKFCPECGASLVAKKAEDPKWVVRSAADSASRPERRQLTVMFCDMVGSSALSTRLDPEEQGDVIAAFHACCANEVKSLGGMVAQYLGDGVLAYFGYPTAHENDAERAILSGLAILKAVATLKAAGDVALQTRIAIGSGVVVVGDLVGQSVTQENAAIGETTNLVARLQAIAEPNSLVISPVTHRLVGALFDYRDLGRHTLKGFSEPVHVRQVLGPSEVEGRFEAQHPSGTSPLLGREEELDLKRSLTCCCAGGSRQRAPRAALSSCMGWDQMTFVSPQKRGDYENT
jgi:class 3 adenylate cyclase